MTVTKYIDRRIGIVAANQLLLQAVKVMMLYAELMVGSLLKTIIAHSTNEFVLCAID